MSDALPPSPQGPPAAFLPPQFEATRSATSLLQSVIDQTTRNMLKLGSLTMDRFAQDPSEELEGFDIPLVDPANPHSAGYHTGDATRQAGNENEVPEEIPNVAPAEAVRYLREVTTREFGAISTDPLKYEFFDELGENQRSCILTITRPNGLSRSYRTKPEFPSKSEAKIAAASSAIQLGAVHFIKHGEGSRALGRRGLVLAKLDAGIKKDEDDSKNDMKLTKDAADEDQVDSAISKIETCCIEWRAGVIIPKWIHLYDPKVPNFNGYALKICLSANLQRAYSVTPSQAYHNRKTAKAACARVALEQNVLEFIKHGDGLEVPIVVPFSGAEALPPPPPSTVITLQAFYGALPQPLPDPIGVKANGEINAVSWLNATVQTAKGSRMVVTYTWYTDAKLGLHGCLLHLSRPDNAPSQSYIVDAVFSKRADAKLAVCLLACSQGVGKYVREISAEVDSRVTPDMRKRATEQILPGLAQALNRFRHGTRPEFTYGCEISTFDCTMTLDLSPSPEAPFKKSWSVPLAYKSKADAKFAVLCSAADDGMIEFIRSQGKMLNNQLIAEGDAEVEPEEGETDADGKRKKKGNKVKKVATDEDMAVEGEVEDSEAEALKKVRNSRKKPPVFETRDEALANRRFRLSASQRESHSNGRGRGGAFGNRGGFRGNARGTSGFGAQRRPFGVSSGYPRPPAPPSNVPPFHHADFDSPASGPGYPGGPYGGDFGHSGRGRYFHDRSNPGFAHGRHVHGPGGAGANAETPFAHVPPPVPPHAAPGWAHNERARDYNHAPQHPYRPGPHVPPHYSGVPFESSGRPYGYDRRSAAPGFPPHSYRHPRAPEHHYTVNGFADRPAHGVPRASEAHYAPDYDRIPDSSSAVSSQAVSHPPSESQSSSHSPSSIPPRGPRGFVEGERHPPTEPRRERIIHNHAPTVQDSDTLKKGDAIPEGASHGEMSHPAAQPPTLAKPDLDTKEKNIEQELNNVISRLEKEADEKSNRGSPHPRRKDSGKNSRQRSRSLGPSNNQPSVVPSKRGRSSDREGRDSQPNKRQRKRSKSKSRPPERGRPVDRDQPDPSSGRSKSVSRGDPGTVPEKPVLTSDQPSEKKGLKRAREPSPVKESKKRSRHKKSYVASFYDYCDKEGIPRPELRHEERAFGEDNVKKVVNVWLVLGTQRLELPRAEGFNSLEDAKERMAKSVLGHLRVIDMKKKAKKEV